MFQILGKTFGEQPLGKMNRFFNDYGTQTHKKTNHDTDYIGDLSLRQVFNAVFSNMFNHAK